MKSAKISGIVSLVLYLMILSPINAQDLTHYVNEGQKGMNLPFSTAVIVGDIIYLSGQIGNVDKKNELVPGGIQAETKKALDNIKAVLEANNSSLDNVIKVTVMMADMSEWKEMNEIYVSFFPNSKPARSAFGTSGLALNARMEIECIALIKKE